WRAAVFQRRVVEKAAGCTGVTVVRGEVPFQVSRGRMERCTSVTVFGGTILIVYWNGDTSRGRQGQKGWPFPQDDESSVGFVLLKSRIKIQRDSECPPEA